MALVLNGSTNTIGGLAVGGVPDGTTDADALASNAVTNAKVADDAIGVAELSATGTASSSTFLRGDNSWASLSSPMFEAGKVALIQHQTSGSTGGGSTTSGAYNTVPWTNETLDPGGIVSLSSNVITIGPGTYQMFANHLFYRVDSYVWGLKITSASGDHYWGTAGFAGNGDYDEQVAHCYCRHINDTGGDETMIAHYRCQTGQSSDGVGHGKSFGAGNVLGQWWILKEA